MLAALPPPILVEPPREIRRQRRELDLTGLLGDSAQPLRQRVDFLAPWALGQHRIAAEERAAAEGPVRIDGAHAALQQQRAVTTLAFLWQLPAPAPRTPQKSSGSCWASVRTTLPSASTSSAARILSIVRPCSRAK